LSNFDLHDANLGRHIGTPLGRLDFEGANFSGVQMTDGRLNDCSLIKTCFQGVTLDRVNLAGANLRGASFEGASLIKCNFTTSRCRGTNFRNADLTRADFSHADLCGADLSSANLEGARFSEAKHDNTTRFPPGFDFSQKPVTIPDSLQIGQKVTVRWGTFEGFEGPIQEIDPSNGLLEIELEIFGRKTYVKMEYDDVEPI
ncbi:MAG: pentapeptide repeat-containing protein, partial [Planctomycetaceae bacterium]|nr:pentapeptide repeat-containing protein [Planctomycetaceae bacterium]